MTSPSTNSSTSQIVRAWHARYKARQIEVCETRGHQNWISTREIRKVFPSLRADSQLLKEYAVGVKKLDNGPRFFFSESALSSELQRMRSRDALMFLAWLEKTIIYPAARKREGAPALEAMPARPGADVEGASDEDLHIPVRKTPPVPRLRDFRRQPLRPLQTGELHRRTLAPVLAHWRGESELARSIVAGGLALVGWIFLVTFLIRIATDSSRYTGAYVLKQWFVLLLFMSLCVGLVWWGVGVMRCALRRQREGRSFFESMLGFVFGLTSILFLMPVPLVLAAEWMQGLWITVRGDAGMADVVHDQYLGRIVVRGELGFGTFKRLEKALQMQPRLTLVQIESPGGYVVEGMAMAALIEKNRLDTVSLESCASACTLLLAAGQERYLSAGTTVGFHRSGLFGYAPSTTWNPVDHEIAAFYKSRETSEDFIKQALDTPFNKIWNPPAEHMFAAGFATKWWSERKEGY